MARGGKREGAGRKNGSRNKRSEQLEATIASLVKAKAKKPDGEGPAGAAVDPNTVGRPLPASLDSEAMPLDFILEVMRDTERPLAVRLAAATHAAPYCHAKLATVEHKGKVGLTHEEALKALA